MRAKSQARRLRLSAEFFDSLSQGNIDHLAGILARAYLLGQTPQQAAVDAAAYIGQCAAIYDPIPDGGPTPADMRGEVPHD